MKTIFIVGPTATGKTDLAIALIPFLLNLPGITGVDLLSADSKQVYTHQDIVTGKDKEKFAQVESRFEGKVSVHGIDEVAPDEEWSVAHFLKLAQAVLTAAEKQGRIVVVVGGTGLYLSSLVNPPETALIPRDDALRMTLEPLPVPDLQQRLREVNPKKWESLNESDRSNPRRLVRAIEVAQGRAKIASAPKQNPLVENPLWIGLRLEQKDVEARILSRVEKRLAEGAALETKNLLKRYPNWTREARSAIGYKEIESFVSGKIGKDQLIKLWSLHELQYASRQMTWFNSQRAIEWFNGLDYRLLPRVEATIGNWYTVSK